MARNIEIKARIESVDALRCKAAALATEGPVDIFQDDTFFTCERGRMKLRQFTETRGELIFYQRSNQPGPKASFYVTSPTSSPGSLREALTHAYGQVGRIEKQRTLFLAGRTRVHIDHVKDLGHFLELEVVLDEGEMPEAGVAEAHDWMKKLGVTSSQLIDGAYIDLLSSGFAQPGQHP